MAKSDEEEQRERLELLKLKQGIISESEVIPEEVETSVEAPKTAKKKIENFFYYYKWIILIGILVATTLGVMIYQTVSRDDPDIKVLLVETVRGSGLSSRSSQVELALEQYCPDFNGDDKTHVAVTAINLGVQESDGQYYVTQMMLFDNQLTSEACIIVSDKGFYDYMRNEVGATDDAFLRINGEFSVPVAETKMGEVLQEFPEDAYVYFLKIGRSEGIIRNSEQVLNAITTT